MHRLRDILAYTAVWLAIEVGRVAAQIVPRRIFLFLSTACADLAFYLFSGFRRRSIKNLSLAFGDRFDAKATRTIVRASLRNFFRSFCELGFAVGQTPQQIRSEIPVEGHEHLAAALARGQGVIALSGHLGNFFLVGTRLAGEGCPTHVLIKQPKTGTLAKILDHYRLKIGQNTIHARPRREAFRELTRVLRQNEIAVIIADEYRSGSGILVPFFGRVVRARRGPATLALRTGAALVPVYLARRPTGELVLMIEPELAVPRTGRTQADVKESTRRITQWLEKTVRAYPDQWNWMNIHWQQISPDELLKKDLQSEKPEAIVADNKTFQPEETK
jgi:KDO2-lipid IV(A) lauroyltransferase